MSVECKCNGKYNNEMFLKDSVENTCCDEYVFLKGGISFLISDDLQVKVASPSSLVQMLSNVGLSDMNQIKEMQVEIGKNEVILKGCSGLGCIDNLYKSVEAVDLKWFNAPSNRNSYTHEKNVETILLKPGVAPHHKSEYQLLQISERRSEIHTLYDIRQYVRGAYVEKFEKFTKEPSLFYIMDNLEVRPLSSSSTICLLQELNVPVNDVEEQTISVGELEALNLLKASLTSSSSALTEGLNHRLKKQIDEDVKCNAKKLCHAVYCFKMENKEESKVFLKLLVDEKKEQVIAAEAKADFMDILFSLLTLPLGMIIQLIRKAEGRDVGCMNHLRRSVENLSEKYLLIEHCKTMLLSPRNPYPKYCMRLKVDVNDSGSEKYYQCSECSKKSYFTNVDCSCDGTFNKETVLKDLVETTCCDEYVFLKGGMSFLISDDLQVKCASPSSLVQMISSVGLNDMNRIKEMNVEVGKNEVICLLARSIISKTPLSDVFLPKQKQKRARVDTKMVWRL